MSELKTFKLTGRALALAVRMNQLQREFAERSAKLEAEYQASISALQLEARGRMREPWTEITKLIGLELPEDPAEWRGVQLDARYLDAWGDVFLVFDPSGGLPTGMVLPYGGEEPMPPGETSMPPGGVVKH